jgi:hypothetical protein
MKNVNAPIFIHLGKRLRAPEGTKIGSISNVKISNITAKGPYVAYKTIPWNYISFTNNMVMQYHWNFNGLEYVEKTKERAMKPWQFTSNICGLPNHYLKNITFENFDVELYGGVKKGQYEENVPDDYNGYPEIYAYGWTLPSSGFYFRHIENLKLKNINFHVLNEDQRELMIFDDVK